MGLLEETLRGRSLADYTNSELKIALNTALYTNTADMWSRYLVQQGYSGSVADMMAKWWNDNKVTAQFRNYINSGLYLFNPQNLFAADSPGYLYDLDDLSTVFLDSAGTTPATVNGLVGLVLDKSQGGVMVARRNLLTYTEQFDNAAWTKTQSAITANSINAPDGTLTADKIEATGAAPGVSQDAAVASTSVTLSAYLKKGTAADKANAITLRNQSLGSNLVAVRVNLDDGSITYLAGSSGATATSVGDGWWRIVLTANITSGNTIRANILGGYGATIGDFSYICGAQLEAGSSASAYQRVDNAESGWIRGNHRYQGTTGSKPILRGTPTGANLASGASWTAGTGWSVAGNTATATTSSGTLSAASIAAVVGKHYRVTYTITRTAGSIQPTLGGLTGTARSASGTYVQYFDNATSTAALVFTGTGFTGTVTLNTIEAVDVSAGSVTAPYALQYDGVDDFLQTASVDFSATDKVTVCHGVRTLASASPAILVELGPSVGSNPGTFYISMPEGSNNIGHRFRGSLAGGTSTVAGYTAPYTKVISLLGDIAGDVNTLRANAVQVGTSATDQGAGNLSNLALYFGRRAGTELPYNGLEYSSICIGRLLTAAELANVERWVARKTGLTL